MGAVKGGAAAAAGQHADQKYMLSIPATFCVVCLCLPLCLCECVQGASIGYALTSALPEFNDKISVLIQMGPVVYNDFFVVPFMRAMASVGNDRFMLYARSGEFLWSRTMAPFV